MNVLERSKTIRVALAGNPNSGKSTMFNVLTGGHVRVGNWPGVTVEKKEGRITYEGCILDITDLPGTYSLTSYSIDERIARDFIVRGDQDVVVTIIDSTNLERNLYLTVLILELGANVVLDLNMSDLIKRMNVEIDTGKLGEILKVPVVLTSALKKTGVEDLKRAIVRCFDNTYRRDEEFKVDYGEEIEDSISAIIEELNGIDLPYPKRFLSIKMLEGDIGIIDEVRNRGYERAINTALKEKSKLEAKYGYDLEAEIIERRYKFIERLVTASVRKIPSPKKKLTVSDKIDRIVTNRWLGIPVFAFILWATFQLTFTVGGVFAEYIDTFFGWLGGVSSELLEGAGASKWVVSLIGDGVIGGIGSVIVFLPNIMILFMILAFLEDVGYLARAAFIMDKVMHSIGLPGRSFIPMILGFGCNVPAIMATRTIPSERDRLLTILINPFMSCSARLPVYVLFTGIFFEKHEGLVLFGLYSLGLLVAVLSAKLFKTTIPRLKGPVSPLVMELPPYRLPSFKGVLLHMWLRSVLFLRKAGTIIFGGVVLVWLLASFPLSAEYASESSLIGRLGSFLDVLFKPTGFGFWQAAVALFFGIIAKEIVVGTFGTLFGGEEKLSMVLREYFTPLSSVSFMVMSLLYIPCIASVGVIYRETNSLKWTVFAVAYSLVVGWFAAFLVYVLGSIII